jgi:hypothetical protein
MKLSLPKANSEQRELDEAFSTMIRARDGWACCICGNDRNLCAHHILPREHKEFRYCEDNALTLCVTHHKFSRVISAHNAPLAFFLWLGRFHPIFFNLAVERNKKIMEKDGIQLN